MILFNFLALLCRETCPIVDLEIVQDPAKLSLSFYQKMRMEIEQLEGKFKLGQERSPADKQSLLKNLESAKPARSIRELTASFYRRNPSTDRL